MAVSFDSSKPSEAAWFRPVKPLLLPKSVALVGASDKGAWPRALHQNFGRAGFAGTVYYVNPGRSEIWGEPCYPDLAALPEAVDHALIIVPADAVMPVLQAGSARGVKFFTIYAAGFGEGVDPRGIERSRQVSQLVEEQGVRICGPNCMGFISTPARLWTYPSRRLISVPAGPVGIVFQSGGTLSYWLTHGVQRGLGFSYAISSGNELDLDLADYINFMVGDENTKIIACMIEGIRRPRPFMEAARRALQAQKPLLVVKIGRTAAAQASSQSHTGALAGDDRVFDAVCDRYGITRCESLDEMLEVTLALSGGRIPDGSNVAVVSSSGGAKGLMLDAIAKVDITLATPSSATFASVRELVDPVCKLENPLDTGAGAANDPKGLSAVCQRMLADPAIDLLAFLGRIPVEENEQPDVDSVAAIARSTDKPVFAFSQMARTMTEVGRQYQKDAGIPFLQGIPQAANAIKAVVRFGEKMRTDMPAIMATPLATAAISDAELVAMLAARGVRSPASVVAYSIESAAAAAGRIGYPVALKALSSRIVHKTEFGAVRLDLRSAEEVTRAADDLKRTISKFNIDSSGMQFLVQKMVSGLEVILGARVDPHFGPYAILGLGGVLVEAIQDVAIRMLPITRLEARNMIKSLRGASLFGAFRGREPRDVDALVDAVVGLTDVFLDHRAWLSDLEINPLMVLEQGGGVYAVDIRPIRIKSE